MVRRDKMKKSLTIKDRLVIANQYDILSNQATEECERENYENLRDIFVNGYSKYYSLATEFFTEEVSESECEFVTDVLSLYRDLYFSWNRNDEMKKVVDERDVLFEGFDLNDSQEVKYFSFYKFLVERLKVFTEIKELMEAGKIEDFNSHGSGPSMNTLSNMVLKREDILSRREIISHKDLSIEEVQEILNAK